MSVLRRSLVMELQVFDDVISQSSLDSIENALAKKVPWHLLQDDYDTGSWSLGGIRTKEDFGEIEEYLLHVLNQKGFDGNGNYTLGIKEQIIFPEISIDKVNRISGMNITIVTDSSNDLEGFELLKAFGMPFVLNN